MCHYGQNYTLYGNCNIQTEDIIKGAWDTVREEKELRGREDGESEHINWIFHYFPGEGESRFFSFLEQDKDFYKTIRFCYFCYFCCRFLFLENISKDLTFTDLYGQCEVFFRLLQHKYISDIHQWRELSCHKLGHGFYNAQNL